MNDIIVFKYEIWEFNPTSQKYELRQQIREHDIISWTYAERNGVEVNELLVELKPLSEYTSFCVHGIGEENKMNPIILKKVRYVNGQATSDYEVMCFRREDKRNEQENIVRFTCYDFKFLEARRLITTNRDFSEIREPSDEDTTAPAVELPDNFAKFVRNTNIQTVLEELYQKAITAPLTIEYGAIGTPDPNREIKGMGVVSINTTLTKTVDVSLEQMALLEAKDTLFSQLDFPLQTYFNTTNGVINVQVQDGRKIDDEVVRKRSQILSEDYLYEQTYNYVSSHGKANVTYTTSDVKSIDFGSYETQEDYSFTAGNNQEYLIAPTQKELKNRLLGAQEFLKLNVVDPFSIMRAGDYFTFDGRNYTIIQIQEEFKEGSPDTYDFEIEERNN